MLRLIHILFRLSNDNAFDIIEKYDLILDCTDTPATRYLINDVSVICGKTIVSGSGLKTDGQLSILNFHGIGPCYRCFYPNLHLLDLLHLVLMVELSDQLLA